MSCLSCSLHEGEESRENWHQREKQEVAHGNYMLVSQEGVGEPQRKPSKFIRPQAHGQVISCFTWEEGGGGGHWGQPTQTLWNTDSLFLVPSLREGVGSSVWVPLEWRTVPQRLSTPWWWQMLCVRGGGSTTPFEEESLPLPIYLLLLNDSVIQPQNQSPEEGRKSPALKPQCPCEVLLCGTFLKNNHIRRPWGWRNPQPSCGAYAELSSLEWGSLGNLTWRRFLRRDSMDGGVWTSYLQSQIPEWAISQKKE